MPERLRVAIIGAGYGEVHIQAFGRRRDVEIVAVCSKRGEIARSIAERYDIPLWTTSYDEALDAPGLSAVSITTPPSLHHEIALAAVARGLHVLCEKPLARSAHEAAEMLSAAKSARVIHATNFDYRIVPDMEKFHRLLKGGYLGELYHAHMHWLGTYHADPEVAWTWRNSGEEAGLGMLGDLNHGIDDLLWHFGPIDRIVAVVRTLIHERWDPESRAARTSEVDDAATLIAMTEEGAPVSALMSRCAVHAGHRFIECFGSDGTLKLTMPDSTDRWTTTLSGARREDRAPHDLSEPTMREQVKTTQDRFVEAIHNADDHGIASFDDGLAAMRVTDALFESSATGRWISIGRGATDRLADELPEIPGTEGL